MQLTFAVLTVLSAAWWLVQAFMHAANRRLVKRLSELPIPSLESRPKGWPTLSVVIAAKNEAEHVAQALESKLGEGYPALEIVFVDDRSTDETGAIAEAFAKKDSRVKVTHVTSLPEGWLGKVSALEHGMRQASGEWVLFSDADVILEKGTLMRLISYAEDNGLDHIPVLPSLTSRGALLSPALVTFMRFIAGPVPLWKARDPKSKVGLGSGAFSLFRRRAYDASPGLQFIKMDIADDVAFGAMLKRAGARQEAFVGQHEVSLEFYPSYAVLARQLEKNGASTPAGVMLVGQLLAISIDAGFLTAALSATPWVQALGALTVAVSCATQFAVASWLRIARWPALVPWFGVLPLAMVLTRSAVLALIRGGVVWRGTFYSTKAVRAGARFGPNMEKHWPRSAGPSTGSG